MTSRRLAVEGVGLPPVPSGNLVTEGMHFALPCMLRIPKQVDYVDRRIAVAALPLDYGLNS